MNEPEIISQSLRQFGDAPELLVKITRDAPEEYAFQVFEVDTAKLLAAGSGKSEMAVRHLVDDALSAMLAAREDPLYFQKRSPSA